MDKRRHAYGFQRTERDFAHVEGIDLFWFDGKKTERQERRAMLAPAGVRDGDEVVMVAASDLGSVGERKHLERLIAERGATIRVEEPPRPLTRPGPKPKLASLSAEQKAACARLWLDLTVPGAYAHRRIQDIAGWQVTRNQLNHFFGPRSEPTDEGRRWLKAGAPGVDG